MATLDRVNNSRSFDKIYKTIKQLLENARSNSYRAVNFAMVVTYWEIAFPISHSVGDQSGHKKSHAMRDQSSIKNIIRSELSWTHYRLLLKLEKKKFMAELCDYYE